MEVGWLEDFLALAASGSFSRAAEARRLTQPAFSRRIKALETWVGATLFDRSSHPASLTEAGRRFRPVADEVLRQLSRGRDEARQAQSNAASTIRFAATHSLSLTFFPEWLRGLEAAGPIPSVRLDSDNLSACEQLLASGQSQFLLCHDHPAAPTRLDPRQFRSVRIGSDVLVPVVAPGPDGGPRPLLPGTAEAPVPHLAYAEVSGLGRAVAAALSAREAWLQVTFVAHIAALLRAMAREGRGVAWMPLTLVGPDLARGELVPAGDETWNIPVEIRLFRQRGRLSPAAEALWSRLA